MATSRLKKKLESGDTAGLGNLLESFVSVGTPLPSLADKKDVNEFKPIWEQEVVDEKGRRRLHGAFTGGFSAGYFNTAGSKEGWKPSTFTSSRSERANAAKKSTAEQAEAFMDEEDLAELASARTLQTASSYSAPSAAYDPLTGNLGAASSNAAMAGATADLASLIQPSTSRIGAKLMRKMGWRDGQGVGPRVTLLQRKKQAFEIGIKLDLGEENEDLEGEASKHYYPPLDRPLNSLKEVGVASDRGWGLGYTPGPTVANLTKSDPQGAGSNSTARVTAFDDDDEEDDVYSAPMNSVQSATSGEKRKWGIVDLDEERSDYRIQSSSSSRSAGRSKAAPPPRTKSLAHSFHDGTAILAGFSQTDDRNPIPSTSQLPTPPPRNWTPNPQRIWAEAEKAVSSDIKGKGKALEAEERGTLLGEKLPPPPPKSVFDYLSAKAKERLASVTAPIQPSASSLESKSNNSHAAPPEPEVPLLIPPLDGPTALAALKGFQPFSASSSAPDAARQARYTLYLQFQAHLLPPSNSTLPFGPRKFPNGKTQSIAELNRELDDYARAARVFKPVTGMLAGRFTSGGAGVIAPSTAEPGLYQPVPKVPSVGIPPKEADAERLTPAQNAVRNDMFGPLTHSVEKFRPAKLVCKRFAVPVPYGAEEEEEEQVGGAWGEAGGRGGAQDWGKRGTTGEVLGKKDMEALMMSTGFKRFQPPPEVESFESNVRSGANSDATKDVAGSKENKANVRSAEAPSLANVGLGDDESQGAETLTYQKAPRDIFAAIFADSDDEDDDDDDDDEDETDHDNKAGTDTPSSEATSKAPLRIEAPPPLVQLHSASRLNPLPLQATLEDSSATLDSTTISTYKPSYAPASARSTKDTKDDQSGERVSTKKKKKKVKNPKVTLSFDAEEGEEVDQSLVVVNSVKRRKLESKVVDVKKTVVERKMGGAVEVMEEDEWQEVKSVVHPSLEKLVAPTVSVANPVVGGKRVRERASDLY